MNKTEKIIALDKDNPALSNREIANAVNCTRRLVRMIRNTPEAFEKRMPKILLYDIETAPLEVYVWRLWKNVVPPSMLIKGLSMLSWSAKWLFDSKVYGEVVRPGEAHARVDGSILDGLWNLLDEADIVIAHNGMKFDTKIVNARFALSGMAPPMPFRQIDTLRAAKRVFNVDSFKLDDLCNMFGLQQKMEHEGMNLWKKCVNHDSEALDKMLDYNKVDVIILEELYLKLRPWIKSHPNVALYIDTLGTVCTNCGSEELSWGGYYYTPAGKYRAFRCSECGAIGRSRTSDLTKEARAQLLLSIAA